MLDLRDMLKAGIHFGHKTSRWFPKMRPYIWGSKNKIHLIDISKTAFLLEQAGKYVKSVASKGKSVLWVGTKKPAQKGIKATAELLKQPYVINRWIGGTLSNFEQVKKAITRLLHLRDVLAKPTINYTKKEVSVIQKEIERLEKNIGGIIDLQYPPAAVIVVDAKREQSAVKEASRLKIPVIAMVDTNTDPRGVSLVIPANDDSPKSINFVLNYLQKCVEEGQAEYAKVAKAKADEKEAKKNADKKVEKKEAKPVAPVKTKSAAKPVAKPAPAKAKPAAKSTEVKEAAPKAEAKKPVEKKEAK